jgi:LSD1 subclass zinc finger protein
MSLTSIACPGCHTPLKTAAPPPGGKRLRCPRCQARFLHTCPDGVPAPARRRSGALALGAVAVLCGGGLAWGVYDLVLRPQPAAVAARNPAASPRPARRVVAVVDAKPAGPATPRPAPGPRARPGALAALASLSWDGPRVPSAGDIDAGRELFHREWQPDDPRSHGGDGLGPVFNDSSCVACHNLGGPGGAGPVSKNVDIITATSSRSAMVLSCARSGRSAPSPADADDGSATPLITPEELQAARAELDELAKIHAGFRASASVVLHLFGTDPDYGDWRAMTLGLPGPRRMLSQGGMMGMMGGQQAGRQGGMGATMNPPPSIDEQANAELSRVRGTVQAIGRDKGRFRTRSVSARTNLVRSQRNPTPLFGAGLIDAVPDEVLREASRRRHRDFPEVTGRLALQADGRIGRFGWKAQTASLEDFVLTACAVELGLEVPGHSQGGVPSDPAYKGPGLDMDQRECDALIAFVRQLPAPEEQRPASDREEARLIASGREVFANVGCAACHTPDLGHASGIYSDLLLHDMGDELGDTGQYGIFVPDSPGLLPGRPSGDGPIAARPASRREWRTPPLWGVRDSGPYMHDGRAETLEQAIALHGGQGEPSARRYFARTPRERLQLQTFLKSLVAPALARR